MYKRILLKLSGEAFLGEREYGIDPIFTQEIVEQVLEIHQMGVQIGIVVGGGNIFRGSAAAKYGLDRTTGEYMGILAGVMNALALQDAFVKHEADAIIQSAIDIPRLAETYIRQQALHYLEKNRIVIFAGGTGNPYSTHDTAGALRALEIRADILLKATKVDGVYDQDPTKHSNAHKFSQLGYKQVIEDDNIQVMDKPAIQMCLENSMPILVFDITDHGNLKKAIMGDKIGTIIS